MKIKVGDKEWSILEEYEDNDKKVLRTQLSEIVNAMFEQGIEVPVIETDNESVVNDWTRRIDDSYRALLLDKEMDIGSTHSCITKLSECSVEYINNVIFGAAMIGIDTDDITLIDDLRPLEDDDMHLEDIEEAIPMESLDRVDEDIKRNYFGDYDLDEEHRKNRFALFEEHDRQKEYDRFVNVLKGFVSEKMTSAYKKPITEKTWSFNSWDGSKFPKWKWFRPHVSVEAKRIFDLWCGEFLEYRSMPISYMWSFLKSRLIINGWTNRGLGRKEWDWSEESTKALNSPDFDRDTFDKEHPCPKFEYSADWRNAEIVEINYLKAIEDFLMEKWDKQTKETAPIIDLSEWNKMCNAIVNWKNGSKIKVTMFVDPRVCVVPKPTTIVYSCSSVDISWEVDGVNSSLSLKDNVIPIVNFSRFTRDDTTKTITVWLTENIKDEVYKAYEIQFIDKDEEVNEQKDVDDVVEQFTKGVSDNSTR